MILRILIKTPAIIGCLILVVSGYCSVLNAQSMAISEGLSIKNDYGYDLIGRLRDRILLFRDKYNDFEIQAYDDQMRPAWNRELNDIEHKGVQIICVSASRNDFSVIFKHRKKGRTTLRVHKYDPGAKLIDSMVVKDYGERVFSPPVLDFVRSEDRNCIVVYNTAEQNLLESTCLRLDKMQVLWDKTIHTSEDQGDLDDIRMVVSDKGDFFLSSEHQNKRNKAELHEVHLLKIGIGTDEEVIRFPLTDVTTVDSKLEFDNLHGNVVISGLYADKNRDRSNGVFFFSYHADSKAKIMRREPFDDKFISILRQKNVEDDTKGILDCDVDQIVLRQDGGALLFVELHHEIQRGTANGRGFMRDGSRMVVDFYYEDMFVIAISPKGEVQWKTILHKKQYSQDDEGTFSSFFLMRQIDRLRFLFNDEIKTENTCSEYVISPIGEFDRNSLLTTEGQNMRLRFRDALQVSAQECLIPSEYRNKLRLVLLKY